MKRNNIGRLVLLVLILWLVVTTPNVSSGRIYHAWFPMVMVRSGRSGPMGDFYVDNSGADGDGSFANPWNNIAGHVNDLAAGDTMHVRGNASAPARVYMEAEIDITVSGGAGNRITLQPYLSELVVIKPDAGHLTFDIHGTYWEIKDLEVDYDGRWWYGFLVRGSHTIIRGCEIHNSHNHNIVVDNGITDTEIRDNVMYDFILAAADAHGVMLQIGADRTIIDGNTVYNCAGDAVQFHDGGWGGAADSQDACEITNNHFYRGTLGRSEEGVDIKCSTNLTISDNIMHGYGRGGPVDPSSAGIKFTNQVSSGAVIEDNIIYNCANDGITLTGNGVSTTVLRRNLIYDITTRGIRVHSGGAGVDVYNNTIVDVVTHGLRVATWTGGNLKNNLWYNCGNLTLDGGGVMGATPAHNGRWDTTSDAAFTDPTDTTGIGDPGFVDAANDDYRLQATSNAVDAGVNVGLPFYGPAPDLGYWEYRGATTTTSTTSTTSISITTTTTTLYDPYANALIVNCATALRTSEPLTVAQVIERNAIAAAAVGL